MQNAIAFTIIAFLPAAIVCVGLEVRMQSARTAALRRARIMARANQEGR